MKKPVTILVFVLIPLLLIAQQWTESQYEFEVIEDVEYGTAIDFLGEAEQLYMDVYTPTCGAELVNRKRPLAVVVHGGSFIDGNKSEKSITTLSEKFAERGYVTISVDYRLGFVTSTSSRHCNLPIIYKTYPCLIAADEAEWHRAIYRSIQDVKGAIRYMVNRHEEYDIDMHNIFIVGESAGACIALGVGLLDVEAERDSSTYELLAIPKPHSNSSSCSNYKGKSFPTDSIPRPDLGSIDGNIEPTSLEYTIKGIGNFFGGMFTDLILNHNPAKPKPSIYSFHQPCDLIVPIEAMRVYKGMSDCIRNFNCAPINNTPIVYSGKIISKWNDENEYGYNIMNSFTDNNIHCAQQVINEISCHDYDNSTLRWQEMFEFFAPQITIDSICGIEETTSNIAASTNKFSLYPNPVSDDFIYLDVKETGVYNWVLWNSLGQSVFTAHDVAINDNHAHPIPVNNLVPGLYYIQLKTSDGPVITQKFIRE